MRKNLSLILSCALILTAVLLTGCGASENKVSPPFFKITSPNGGTAYLLGTMHVGLPNTVYPDEVYTALDTCSELAVEVDLIEVEKDQLRVSSAMKLLECRDKDVREIMGDSYGEIKSFFQEIRLYNLAYERYIPAVWSSMLSSKLASDCGYESKYGTDRALLSYAKKKKIDVVELESIEEQYSMNAAEPEELQVYILLNSARTDYEEQKRQLHELYTTWSTNSSLDGLLSDDDIPDELADEYAEYYKAMYTDRQRKMADYIDEKLQNGDTVFVAVGAMHCFAEPDILDFLAEKGYKIDGVSLDSAA